MWLTVLGPSVCGPLCQPCQYVAHCVRPVSMWPTVRPVSMWPTVSGLSVCGPLCQACYYVAHCDKPVHYMAHFCSGVYEFYYHSYGTKRKYPCGILKIFSLLKACLSIALSHTLRLVCVYHQYGHFDLWSALPSGKGWKLKENILFNFI